MEPTEFEFLLFQSAEKALRTLSANSIKRQAKIVRLIVLDFYDIGKRYYLELLPQGLVKLTQQTIEATPTAYLSITASDFLDIMLGRLHVAIALVQNKIGVEGISLSKLRILSPLFWQIAMAYRQLATGELLASGQEHVRLQKQSRCERAVRKLLQLPYASLLAVAKALKFLHLKKSYIRLLNWLEETWQTHHGMMQTQFRAAYEKSGKMAAGLNKVVLMPHLPSPSASPQVAEKEVVATSAALPAHPDAVTALPSPAAIPAHIATKPEELAAKPEPPAVKSETSVPKPEAPVSKPQAQSVAKQEAPVARPELSAPKPEAPVSKPEKPIADVTDMQEARSSAKPTAASPADVAPGKENTSATTVLQPASEVVQEPPLSVLAQPVAVEANGNESNTIIIPFGSDAEDNTEENSALPAHGDQEEIIFAPRPPESIPQPDVVEEIPPSTSWEDDDEWQDDIADDDEPTFKTTDAEAESEEDVIFAGDESSAPEAGSVDEDEAAEPAGDIEEDEKDVADSGADPGDEEEATAEPAGDIEEDEEDVADSDADPGDGEDSADDPRPEIRFTSPEDSAEHPEDVTFGDDAQPQSAVVADRLVDQPYASAEQFAERLQQAVQKRRQLSVSSTRLPAYLTAVPKDI